MRRVTRLSPSTSGDANAGGGAGRAAAASGVLDVAGVLCRASCGGAARRREIIEAHRMTAAIHIVRARVMARILSCSDRPAVVRRRNYRTARAAAHGPGAQAAR